MTNNPNRAKINLQGTIMDKEKFIEMLESANIDHEEWNDHMILIDNGLVEVHFDSEGYLTEIVGAAM